jgi:hypothetical protein
LLITAGGCERRKTKLEAADLTPQEARRILAAISVKKHEVEPPTPKPLDPAPSSLVDGGENAVPTTTSEPVAQAFEPDAISGRWVVDGLVDVGPAAASSASEKGVVLINGDNELFVAKLGQTSASSQPQQTPISPLEGDHGRFAMGRGPTFARLRQLSERLRAADDRLGAGLSMGMSDDYEIAIEEGSTIVRVGRALFGERHTTPTA